MHTCPLVNGIVPHVGGPIITGAWQVMTSFMPQARVTDKAICAGPLDMIAKGSLTVNVANMPAARMGDLTVHGGVIVSGAPQVMIGDSGSGGGAPGSLGRILSANQAARAMEAFNKLSPEDKAKFTEMMNKAKSENERLYLLKALAAGHNVNDIDGFANRIRGQNDTWMKDNLKLTGSSTGTGIQQQWSHSCNATMTQAVRGENDPMYALAMHDNNPNFGSVDNTNGMAQNPNMAQDQANMLQSPYNGGLGPMSGGTAANRNNAGAGSGRWADDLLNQDTPNTGTTYNTQMGTTPQQAVDNIDQGLANGAPVPIVVGDNGANKNAHYAVVTDADYSKNPPMYTIHDPYTGQTSQVPRSDIENGTMNVAGWNQVNATENPTVTPPNP
jgi:uncharacterized Zn-binding protein involved in type VI secretion